MTCLPSLPTPAPTSSGFRLKPGWFWCELGIYSNLDPQTGEGLGSAAPPEPGAHMPVGPVQRS